MEVTDPVDELMKKSKYQPIHNADDVNTVSKVVKEDLEKTPDVKSKITASDVSTNDVKKASIKKFHGRAKAVGAASIGLFALASVVDTQNNLADKRREGKMVNKQEQNLKDKNRREAQKHKEKSYGYVDGGEIVQEMFANRIGHHKMGNAKFQ